MAKVPASHSVGADECDELGDHHSCREGRERQVEGIREENVREIADRQQQRAYVGDKGSQDNVRRHRDLQPFHQGQHDGGENDRRGIER